jgi:hypothetical protein
MARQAERCLHEVWEGLTARGFTVDEPDEISSQCFYEHLGGAYCEMDLLVTGALVWVYEPRWRPDFGPGHAACMVLALLTGTGRPAPEMPPAGPGLALKDAAARMLGGCGLVTEPVDIYYGPGEASAQVMVTNLASPQRGNVRVSDEGIVQWECCLDAPGGPPWGLAPLDVAAAIAAALTGAAGGAR